MARQTLTFQQARKLARTLLEHRQAMGMSTRQLADASGVSRATINRLEMAGNRAPGPAILRALATALGLPQGELLAIGGWLTAEELPTIQPYLRAKYGLSVHEAAELGEYLTALQGRHGSGREGPNKREDEH